MSSVNGMGRPRHPIVPDSAIPVDIHAVEAHRSASLREARRGLRGAIRAKVGAADLVQEAILTAMQCLDRFEGRAGNDLLDWLRAILSNRIAHASRRFRDTARRRLDREIPIEVAAGPASPADALAVDTPSPRSRASRREEARIVTAAIEGLDPEDRSLLRWRHEEGCSFAVIGRRLGRSDVAARTRYLEALIRLKHALLERGLAE